MTEEWPKNSQYYIPVREAMKDADILDTDSGEAPVVPGKRDGFADKAQEQEYWDKVSECENDLINF